MCDKIVEEAEIIRSKGKTYHKGCLHCTLCKEPLLAASSVIYIKDNQLYCKKDYQKLYLPICTCCGDFVQDNCISANEEWYHSACFKCKICGKGLDNYGQGFGELRCSEHIETPVKSPIMCGFCEQEITG